MIEECSSPTQYTKAEEAFVRWVGCDVPDEGPAEGSGWAAYMCRFYERGIIMSGIDQNHIRKELVRLSKMARELRMPEVAHFIDVAQEVASEMNTPKADRSKVTRH